MARNCSGRLEAGGGGWGRGVVIVVGGEGVGFWLLVGGGGVVVVVKGVRVSEGGIRGKWVVEKTCRSRG